MSRLALHRSLLVALLACGVIALAASHPLVAVVCALGMSTTLQHACRGNCF